jgi:hypothetical protein
MPKGYPGSGKAAKKKFYKRGRRADPDAGKPTAENEARALISQGINLLIRCKLEDVANATIKAKG